MPGQHVGNDREEVTGVQCPDPGNAQLGFGLGYSLWRISHSCRLPRFGQAKPKIFVPNGLGVTPAKSGNVPGTMAL